jgi:hypothetical protein
MHHFLLLILLFCGISQGFAQAEYAHPDDENYTVIKDLRKDWVTLSKNNSYIPFIENSNEQSPVISFKVDLKQYQGLLFKCCLPKGSTILINQKIVDYQENSSCILYELDSLYKQYKLPSVWVSIYNSHRAYPQILTQLVEKKNENIGNNLPMVRSSAEIQNFFAAGLIVLLLFYAILSHRFPKVFKNYHSFRNISSLNLQEDMYTRIKLLNSTNLMFLLHYGLLVAYLIIIFAYSANVLEIRLPGYPLDSFSDFFAVWIKVALLVIGVFALKYVMVAAVGALFQLSRIVQHHILDYFRMSLTYGVILFTILVFTYLGLGKNYTIYYNIFVYSVVVFTLLRVFLLYHRLFDISSFRNIYLFSYICTSEILPLFIGFKFFLG